MRLVSLHPLDGSLLREIVRPAYVDWMNRNVGCHSMREESYWHLAHRPGFRRAFRRLGQLGPRSRRRLEAYCAYLTLRPIGSMLRRRDAARAATL